MRSVSHYSTSMVSVLVCYVCVAAINAQPLPPKQAYPFMIRQIHSGHSLTDPLFYPHWPGQYVNLMAGVTSQSSWQLIDKIIGKSTIPGSAISSRWNNPPKYGAPDARTGISSWELLSITERVPLLYEGGSTQQWYIDGIAEQRNALSLFVNNAWENGNNGKGAATLLWTTWVHIDGSSGDFRAMLDVQGREWERMQDHANANRPSGAPPVYLIPGHKMMARLYDDIEAGRVPGITSITQLFSDQIHTNELGAYAIAMIHYACIFNRSPVGLPAKLIPNATTSTPIPSAELAAYLQTMIWDVVTTYDRTGISATTGVSQSTANADVIIAPNPASDLLHIVLPCVTSELTVATIHEVTGTCITTTVIAPATSATTMSVNHLPQGMYTLALTTGINTKRYTVAIHR